MARSRLPRPSPTPNGRIRQFSRTPGSTRTLTTGQPWRQNTSAAPDDVSHNVSGALEGGNDVSANAEPPLSFKDRGVEITDGTLTQAAQAARERFGDTLPEGALGQDAYKIYERLYGPPLKYSADDAVIVEDEEDGGVLLGDDAEGAETGILKEGSDGSLEEVVFDEGELVGREEEAGEETEIIDDGDETTSDTRFVSSPADERLLEDINAAIAGNSTSTAETEESRRYPGEDEEDEPFVRAHPLTIANRFGTSPSTLPMPEQSLVEAITQQLTNTSNVHLAQAAHRVFGGVGLPYSTSTPAIGRSMQQKPIGLDASQSKMSDIEGDVFLATLMPGMYASIMSVLVETRKRLGTAWAEALVHKAQAGELRILDAGGAGAGVLAVRELLKAEWERMHDESNDLSSNLALAEADGKLGGAAATPPLGLATVLTGSDTLRKRASKLLENTTFVPRLPDYLHTEEARKQGKFDLVIAPHTLWPLREDYMRRSHLQNLWGMLSQDGGVLLLLEKGIPRGFELIASARNFLLESRIASTDLDEHDGAAKPLPPATEQLDKDVGMIVAPCTNHAGCPMYEVEGRVKGRRDYCHFEQRYVRPPFLQRILKAKDKNWEDVKFSYISVLRGRDLRDETAENVVQGDEATTRAFEGYGLSDKKPPTDVQDDTNGSTDVPHSLSLPRAVLPPMKRQGHVILDLCTPSGTLERWTVARSYSRQAFRDARKSSWGDLWALGAKTSIPRVPKIKKRGSDADMTVKTVKGTNKSKKNWDADEYRDIMGAGTTAGDADTRSSKNAVMGGAMRGRKAKGFRDKRDKTGSGNGRRKAGQTDADR